MDLYKLRCFVTVVEQGSITKAASHLNMTQPPLSILIRKLEKELNVTLFSRTERRLKLTKAGEVLYRQATKLLAFSEDIKNELIEYERGLRGTVNLGCGASPSYIFLPELIAKLRSRTPNIVIRTSEGPSSFILNELKNQTIDVGIVPVLYEAEEYEITALYKDPLLVVVPSNHPLSKRKSVSLLDLKNENFLLTNTSIGQSISDQIIESCQSSGFSPHVVYWGTDTLPMVNMVLKGLGIAFMPASYKDLPLFNKKQERLHFIKLSSPKLEISYHLVVYKNHYKSQIIEQFINAAKEVAQSFRN